MLTKTAALPMSLARFASSWYSTEARSTTDSIAEFNNSTTRTAVVAKKRSPFHSVDSGKKSSPAEARVTRYNSCRKAASVEKVARKPPNE